MIPSVCLGGTIAPHLRIGDLGPGACRRSALLLGVPAVAAIALWLSDAALPSAWSAEAVLSAATVVRYLAAALRIATH